MQLAIRLPVWVEVPLMSATPEALNNRAVTLTACSMNSGIPQESYDDPDAKVKIHVDYLTEELHEKYRKQMMDTKGSPGEYFFDIGASEWNSFPCRHRHDPLVCKCKLPVYHVGQDEAVFKQFAMPSCTWSINGKTKLRPKTEGMGIMVSSFFCERRGFGFALTEAEIQLVNARRAERWRLTGEPVRKDVESCSSPGLIFFKYGNGRGKQGYWDGEKFQQQCTDFMDVLEIIYPNMQILIEVDHSSGHFKEQSDGLMVNAMGVNWGGKTLPKRDTIMEEGCLGASPPTINGRTLVIGSTQKMIFEIGDPPPFNDLEALPHDRPMTEIEKGREMAKRARRKPIAEIVNNNVDEVDDSYIVQGYVGKNKGILQVQKYLITVYTIIMEESFSLQIILCRFRYCMNEACTARVCKADKMLK